MKENRDDVFGLSNDKLAIQQSNQIKQTKRNKTIEFMLNCPLKIFQFEFQFCSRQFLHIFLMTNKFRNKQTNELMIVVVVVVLNKFEGI